MALMPANHLMLFHTMPKRPTPSILKLFMLKSWNESTSLLPLPVVFLYPSAIDTDAAASQLRANTQL